MKINQIKEVVKSAYRKSADVIDNNAQAIIGVVGTAVTTLSTQAHATLDPDAAAAFTALETAGTDYVAAAWGVAVVIVVGFVGIKLFKKAVSRAT